MTSPFGAILGLIPGTQMSFSNLMVVASQCDQKKITKCLKKLPKLDFTRKMKYFETFTKIA